MLEGIKISLHLDIVCVFLLDESEMWKKQWKDQVYKLLTSYPIAVDNEWGEVT